MGYSLDAFQAFLSTFKYRFCLTDPRFGGCQLDGITAALEMFEFLLGDREFASTYLGLRCERRVLKTHEGITGTNVIAGEYEEFPDNTDDSCTYRDVARTRLNNSGARNPPIVVCICSSFWRSRAEICPRAA